MYCKILVRTGQLIPVWLLSEYLFGIYEKALNAYKPRLYSGRVVYIKSEKRPINHRALWARVIGDAMECHDVPGGHLDIVTQPYAHSWAEKLNDWLGDAQKDRSKVPS
jgi:thioesterase domain-containing protein